MTKLRDAIERRGTQIQRPDILDRMRRFLGVRGPGITPTLASELVPVVVVADIDRPIRGSRTRRSAAVTVPHTFSAVTPSGVGISVPSPFTALPIAKPVRALLKWVELWFVRTAGTDPVRFELVFHPAPVTLFGFWLDSGRGGEQLQGLSSGGCTVNDLTGFPTGGNVSIFVPHNLPVIRSLEGITLTPTGSAGALGGLGSTMFIGADQGAPIGGSMLATFYYEEEDIAE